MTARLCAKGVGQYCEQQRLGNFIDRSGVVGEIEIRRCIHCGHGVSYPPIPDVSFLYERRKSQDYQPDARNKLSRFIKDVAFRLQAKKLLRDIGDVEGRLLDYGCGSGQFTRMLDETASDLVVVGCDFFPDPPAELAKQSYLSHDQLSESGELYEGVLAMHVLEHDDDTTKLLRSITSQVKPGAVVIVEVPNADCVWGGIFGRFWDAWYVPFHRHHFSSTSLRNALEVEGLEVRHIRQVTVPTMGRTIANLFGQKNNVFWVLVGIALHPIQLAGEALTGRRTALRAICRIAD
ncbi:class I SAM-dependent methyltransferase [Marinobacter alexandrii]|uniref:class I SAM-dependent methyltransferase n=1 Tax=Marinobacter alexandrii TaxID=2570351 RepID=UPI003296B298